MDGKKHIAWLTLGICLSLLAWSGQSASGGPSLQGECWGVGDCVPHAAQFGYFPREWREWPGERRPDKTFPQSIGAEVLPTPTGAEKLPLPKASGVPEAPKESGPIQGGQRLPTESPLSPLAPLESLREPPLGLPAEEGILPRGKKIQIQDQSEMPTEPTRPLLEEVPAEQGLPGIPDESESPSMPGQGADQSMPGLPLDPSAPLLPKEDGAFPGLPLDPSAPLLPKEDDALPGLPLDGGARATPSGLLRKPVDWAGAVRPDRKNDLRHEYWATDSLEGPIGLAKPNSHPVLAVSYQAPAVSLAQPRGVRPSGLLANKQASAVAEPAPVPAAAPRQTVPLPLGLDGFCPVQLSEKESWVRGQSQLIAHYRGRTYQFFGSAERERFLGDPQRYAPALSGFDPTLAVDENRHVPGQTAFCAVYAGRVYMFSSAESLARFRRDTRRYVDAAAKRRD